MIGLAALAFASCAKHDFETMTQEQIVKAEYEAKFVAAFGQPASNHTWGFGRATTRAVKPVYASDNYAAYSKTKPSGFTDAIPTSRKPSVPEFATTASAAGALDASTNTLQDNNVYFVKDGYTLENPQNRQNITIYIDDNMTFNYGLGDCKGNKIIVSENKTLKVTSLSTFGQGVSIYLAPGAVLDLSELSYEEVVDWSTMEKVTKHTFKCDNNSLTPATKIYMGAGSKIKGGDLYFQNGYQVLNNGGSFEDVNSITMDKNCVVWNEGSLDVNGNVELTNNGCLLYNAKGTGISATVGSLNVKTDNCVVYNNGDFTCEGALALTDGASEFANGVDGTLKAASVDMKSTSLMYNEGTAIVYGMTKIENSTNKWLNEGSYTSGDFEITGFDKSGTNVWNNCKLIVTATGTGMTGSGNFHLNRGSIILEGGADAGSMLVCDSFTWEDTSGFYLGSKSMVNVIGNIYTDNYNKGYGFYGIGQERSVVKAASITKSADNQYSMSYFGNLYVDIADHFEQGSIDPWGKQLFYHCDETVKFGNESDSPVYIKPSNCNEGYGTEKKEEFPEVYDGRIMAEDLTATGDVTGQKSDWDFNDVVFDWAIKDGKAYIKLLAAGGTLPLTIGGYLDDNGEVIGGVEVHNKFGVGTGTMVNTGLASSTEKEFVLEDGISYADGDANAIKLYVKKGGVWVEITAEQGEPAGKFNCEVGTDWCDEYVDIRRVYPAFKKWVANESVNWTTIPEGRERLVNQILSDNEKGADEEAAE